MMVPVAVIVIVLLAIVGAGVSADVSVLQPLVLLSYSLPTPPTGIVFLFVRLRVVHLVISAITYCVCSNLATNG